MALGLGCDCDREVVDVTARKELAELRDIVMRGRLRDDGFIPRAEPSKPDPEWLTPTLRSLRESNVALGKSNIAMHSLNCKMRKIVEAARQVERAIARSRSDTEYTGVSLTDNGTGRTDAFELLRVLETAIAEYDREIELTHDVPDQPRL